MDKKIEKKYDYKLVEHNKYDYWKQKQLFEPDLNSNKPTFSIILPPPNVTGHLHLGHAWDTSYQDLLIRYKKMQGFNAFWVPGTDHAGIATQTKFEKFLKAEHNLTKDALGKKEFLLRLWDWKETQANFIKSQWAKLGLGLAYKHEKFTMDEDVNFVVNKVFVDLYNKGLIYRAKKLVNWDPILKTAISNIEVIYKETKSKMYYLKYFTEDKKDFVVVATTRPETMFGDTVLIANPQDSRYLKYKNKKFINPANNQLMDLIFDDYIDMSFGTGIMKCTPAHDFNDYQIAKKHNLELINVMNEDGTMNENAQEFVGQDRLECRKNLITKLQVFSLVERIEEIQNNVGYSERTNCIVEPLLSNQWFVKMEPIAKKIIAMQNSDQKVKFVPERFSKTLLTWLENIDDWCISRQLWWGHQLPIWYNKKADVVYCNVQPPKDLENWERDESVLDTWFSSGLWPLATLDWPDKQSILYKKFFPTDVLVTGYDIIFFWVSRMLSLTLESNNTIPFKNVLIHGLIRDEHGKKMSKSLGNGIDPMEVIENYGADALRLFLTSNSTLGEDLNYSNTKVAASWNFLNKLWNGYRFITTLATEHQINPNIELEITKLSFLDYDILNKLNILIKETTRNFDNYNFAVASKNIVNFVWDEFLNNYLELTKIQIKNKQTYCINVLCYVLKQIIKILHPQAPFITEEIYQSLYNENGSIMLENWPTEFELNDAEQKLRIAKYLFEILEISKKIRIENEVANKELLELDTINFLDPCALELRDHFDEVSPFLEANNIKLILNFRQDVRLLVYLTDHFKVAYFKQFDYEAELAYLLKQQETIIFELNRAKNLLSNPNFVAKAAKEKVAQEQAKIEKYASQLEVINKKIAQLKNEIV